MTSVDIPINDIDYESLFGGFETHSNHTTSPTTENDADSRISDTPPTVNGLNNNFDIWPWTMDSPLSDDPNGEHYDFDALINDQNPLMLGEGLTDSDNSTLDDLLAVFELPDQPNSESPLQQPESLSPSSIHNPYPSPPPSSSIVPSSPPIFTQRPILLPRPITTPSANLTPQQQQQQITNCVKLQSYGSTASTGTKCVKIEPIINTTPPQPSPANITIITTSKPITVAKVPVIKMPLTTAATPITIVKTEADSIAPTNVKRITTVYPNNSNTDNSSLTSGTYLKTLNGTNSMISPPTKRRRSESSTNNQQLSGQASEMTTLTLDQLKAKYGNLSEEALKKHLRMIKNRESASLSRKRRKEYMENLDVQNKQLLEENERLKRQNTQLLTRINTLEIENELLKKYSSPKNSLKLMGIFLLFGVAVFMFNPFGTKMNLDTNLVTYENSGAMIPSRTILSERTVETYPNESPGDDNRNYPFIQCVAFINKTHSQRINQDLRSWVQEDSTKQEQKIIPDPKSLSVVPIQHPTRKVARQVKIQSESKGQIQPYKTSEINYDDFIRTIDRKNDTLYFISFKRDHLILPANIQNQTQRPKMTLILPASMANLNKTIHVPNNHVPMLKIDCEVDDTKLVFIKQSHIPSTYRDELSQYYSFGPQASI